MSDIVIKPTPFLKWAGGKKAILNQYDSYFPETISNYYELFLGGGSVFFHLCDRIQFGGVVQLSDSNSKLINAYNVVKNEPKALMTELDELKEKHSKDFYYQVRKNYNIFPLAEYFIYLNKTGFNGLYRESKKNGFNVPVGNYKNPSLYNAENILIVSKALQNVDLLGIDFTEALSLQPLVKHDDTFVYLDPPYNGTWKGYLSDGFNDKKEQELIDVCTQLTACGVKFALSNSDNPFIRQAFAEFNVYEISAKKSINSDGRGRGKIKELLITNY
jgi:DNA adenine methylase